MESYATRIAPGSDAQWQRGRIGELTFVAIGFRQLNRLYADACFANNGNAQSLLW